jgi:BASS family bile acid:Na+ symporter
MNACVALTVFAVMFGIGLGVAPREWREAWRRPGPMLRALSAVLVVVPALALAVTRVLDLPRWAEIGIVLMAISPGAPVALRRSLAAGGLPAFASSLQISVALLAVVSMPLSIAALNWVYDGHASVEPWEVLRQVFVAQLLPLGLGSALRHARAPLAARIEPRVTRAGSLLLVGTVVLALANLWQPTVEAGVGVLAAIALVTVLTLAAGHLLGGAPVAISSALRNPGLALLVATFNSAPPQVTATVLAYVVVSAFLVTLYVAVLVRGGARVRRA